MHTIYNIIICIFKMIWIHIIIINILRIICTAYIMYNDMHTNGNTIICIIVECQAYWLKGTPKEDQGI